MPITRLQAKALKQAKTLKIIRKLSIIYIVEALSTRHSPCTGGCEFNSGVCALDNL